MEDGRNKVEEHEKDSHSPDKTKRRMLNEKNEERKENEAKIQKRDREG